MTARKMLAGLALSTTMGDLGKVEYSSGKSLSQNRHTHPNSFLMNHLRLSNRSPPTVRYAVPFHSCRALRTVRARRATTPRSPAARSPPPTPNSARLIARAGPFTLRVASAQSPFEALVESIVYQQLHGKAAATIHRRLLESFAPVLTLEGSGLGTHPSAQHLLDAPNEQLRAAGLSHNKSLALRDLAAKTIDGTVPTLARIRRMSDQAIIDHLTQVRGIGEWTVEMLLIFRLGRPDILPTGDYGVRKGFALTFQGLKPTAKVTPADLPTAAEMEHRAKKWTPLAQRRQLVPLARLRPRRRQTARRRVTTLLILGNIPLPCPKSSSIEFHPW